MNKKELLYDIKTLPDENFSPPLPVYSCSQDACLHFVETLPEEIPLPIDYQVINQEPWLIWPYCKIKFQNRIYLKFHYKNKETTYNFDRIFHEDLLEALKEGTGVKVAPTASKTDVA